MDYEKNEYDLDNVAESNAEANNAGSNNAGSNNTGSNNTESSKNASYNISNRNDENLDQATEGIDTTLEESPQEAKLPAASAGRRKKKKKSVVLDIASATFDPNAPELHTSWHTHARVICCINSYPNGVTISLHNNKPKASEGEAEDDAQKGTEAKEEEHARYQPQQFHLRFRDTREYQVPNGRHFLYKENALVELESHLSNLHKKGVLSDTVIYFGTAVDPFINFHKRFDITNGCLQLFEQYRPKRLVMQTRSPMVIAGLPTLRELGDTAVAALFVESHLEKAISRYTPGLPKVSERLVAAQGLRRQGVKVNLVVSPVLPYGDFYRDAWDFAELLDTYGDFISLGCLASGSAQDERQLKELAVARKLAADKQFRWLRPFAYRYLHHALSVVAPEKLQLPITGPTKPSQLGLFAA